jgi:ribose transport system permease protein
MLPFASIVAIAAVGQTLVIQHGGLDFSVPGMIALSTIIVTQYPQGSAGKLPMAIGLVLLASTLAGLLSGIAVTRFAITPIVATLGVNALLIGIVLYFTNGNSPGTVPDRLSRFAVSSSLRVPNTVWTALIIVAFVGICTKKTVIGRRFMLVGENARAAHAATIAADRYRVSAYVSAAIAYGLAGVLLAGFLQSPGLFAGDQYLFPTIVAVVLGGTALSGGHGSVVASAVGALFLTQLQQVVLGAGAKPSSQYLIQGVIIALGMAFGGISLSRISARTIRRLQRS